MSSRHNLFSPYVLNSLLTLKNKIVMAPMTRAKADDQHVPTEMMIKYYEKRADAGLIITEGTVIGPNALGYPNVPGIFNAAQIAGWNKVTDAVHNKNGLIFMQIWHVGRVSHPHFLSGELPISASETVMNAAIPRSAPLTYGKSRAATLKEINDLVKAYANAAKNAIQAGFDGIEIHGANGYLIDQFLHYDTNRRLDEYGGTPENMTRFALEVVNACGEAIGYERVSIRLSPGAYLNEIVGDKRDADVFKFLLNELNHLPIAYVHTGNFNDAQVFNELDEMTMTTFMRTYYQGTLIACGGYNLKNAEDRISNDEFDLVAMGRPFIANPDLINMLKQNAELKPYHVSMLDSLE